MVLTATTVSNISSATQVVTLNNPSQVDQVTYSSNSITFPHISAYTLSKSDMALYVQYLNSFNNLLFRNFPTISSSTNMPCPACTCQMTTTSTGTMHMSYTQQSLGTQILSIDYNSANASGLFAARPSPVTITLQEFFMTVYMLNHYFNQVRLSS